MRSQGSPCRSYASKVLFLLFVLLLFISLIGCGGGSNRTPNNNANPISVTVSPTSSTVRANGTQTFTANVTNTTNSAVTWSVQEASGGSITSAGVYTAPVVAGTYHVIATSQADASKSASAAITVTSTPPTFASTPPPDATEGVAYTYTISAADVDNPNGTVRFQATALPEGATLEGNVLTWTPTRSQSRVPNTFTVTAVTSEGVRNPQTWTVAPAGTIRIVRNSDYLTAEGKVSEPDDMNEASFFIIAKDKNGHQQMFIGTTPELGLFEIPSVPAGNYLLIYDEFIGVWTNRSDVDLSSVETGRPDAIAPTLATDRHYTFDGLDPWDQDTNSVEWYMPNINESNWWHGDDLAIGATNLNDTLPVYTLADADKGDIFIANQRVDETLLGVDYRHIVKSTGPLNITDTEGSTTAVNASMVAPSGTINLRAKFNLTEFSAMMQEDAEPSSATFDGYAYPFDLALGVADESAGIFSFNLLGGGFSEFSQQSTRTQSRVGASGSSRPLTAAKLTPMAIGSPEISDVDLGTLAVGNPYPESWKPIYEFDYGFTVPITAPGAAEPALADAYYFYVTDVAPTLDKPVRPVLGPVASGTIDGQNLFADQSGISLTPTLAWEPPSVGTANGYAVLVQPVATVDRSGVIGTELGWPFILYTNSTQITIPEGFFGPGESYVVGIIAVNQPTFDFSTSPFESGFPYAEACSFSGVFTTTTTASATPLSRVARPFATKSAFAAGSTQSTFTNQIVKNLLKRLHLAAQTTK